MACEARVIGYCTNVHAGTTLAQTKTNLDTHAVAVRDDLCPHGTLYPGLWLSAEAARQLREPGAAATHAVPIQGPT